MGKTYKLNQGYKKDRRDSNFKKSNKFKHWKDQFAHKPKVDDITGIIPDKLTQEPFDFR
jgi:hypothetical protein